MNNVLLICFMKQLSQIAKRELMPIVDYRQEYHTRLVKECLSNNKENIKIHYLPSYSPEFNPDEHLNCDLGARVHSGKLRYCKESLKKKEPSQYVYIFETTFVNNKNNFCIAVYGMSYNIPKYNTGLTL
jgi:hypothetical protein